MAEKGIIWEILEAREKERRLTGMMTEILGSIFDHQLDILTTTDCGFSLLIILPDGTDIGFYRKLTPERLEKVWELGVDRLHVVTEVYRKYYRGGPVEGEVD